MEKYRRNNFLSNSMITNKKKIVIKVIDLSVKQINY